MDDPKTKKQIRMNIEQIIADRKRRWTNFYNPELPPGRLFWIHYFSELPARPWPYPDRIDERIEWSWKKYQIQLEQLSWLNDDSLPFLDIYTGTELFAEAFGCQIYYPGNDMPFALPLIHTPDEGARLTVPSIDSAPLARIWKIARELRRRAGPRALLRLPDIQSPMDIAALIWEKSAFYPALAEYPEAVLELAGKIHILLVNFLDAWFDEFGEDFIAHYPDYYVPRGITLSEDEVGAVSPAMFQNIFLPELVRLSKRYGAIGMHCCANSQHQWHGFTKIPNLILLNLVQPAEVIREAYPFFESVTAQMHSYYGEGEQAVWPRLHPAGRRIIFDMNVGTRAEAIALSNNIQAFRETI
jgi:hypothetical protein